MPQQRRTFSLCLSISVRQLLFVAVSAFGRGERGATLPKGPRAYAGKKWKQPVEKEYKPIYRCFVTI